MIMKESKTKTRPWEPIKLTDRHRQGIQLLVAGLSVHRAASLAGISASRLSVVRHSAVGNAYADELHARADVLIVRIMALGLVPEDLVKGGRVNV
jgi:hypothetical protein